MFGLFGSNLNDVALEIDQLITELSRKYLNDDLDSVYADASSSYERAYHHGDSIEIIVHGMRDFSIRIHHESWDEEGENTISFSTGLNSAYQGLMLQVLSDGGKITQIQNNPMIRVTSKARQLARILKNDFGFK